MNPSKQTIIQIVPRLPPAIDGVGDYALNLARQLRKDFDIQTHFIVGNPNWTGELALDGFPISHISDSSANHLINLLSDRSCPVILHYVGYGYAKRGCPVWLVEALETWKQDHENFHLVTMFHEICASGPIWTSSFWLSGLQQNLAKRLTILSDRLVTSKQLYAKILVDLSEGKHSHIPSLPVFSNIGEPEKVPDLQSRKKHLVVFGSPGRRKKAYEQSPAAIEKACHLFQIEQILDIGPPLEKSLDNIGSTPIVILGKLTSQEISEILLYSFAGFINYGSDFLGKSGIFAAYCAHGVLPIQFGSSVKEKIGDGIQSGKHYLNVNELEFLKKDESQLIAIESCQKIATNIYQWYQNHSLRKQAQIFYKTITKISK